jgi:hypothetical protein
MNKLVKHGSLSASVDECCSLCLGGNTCDNSCRYFEVPQLLLLLLAGVLLWWRC